MNLHSYVGKASASIFCLVATGCASAVDRDEPVDFDEIAADASAVDMDGADAADTDAAEGSADEVDGLLDGAELPASPGDSDVTWDPEAAE